MSPSRLATADALISAVLSQYWNGALPVQPQDIAQRLGVQVIEGFSRSSESRPACVVRLSQGQGRAAIEVEPTCSVLRKRFAIAHALGHFLLSKDEAPAECGVPEFSIKEHRLIEAEANRFAIGILVPERALLVLVRSGQFVSVSSLSEIFQVSPVLMTEQINALGPAS